MGVIGEQMVDDMMRDSKNTSDEIGSYVLVGILKCVLLVIMVPSPGLVSRDNAHYRPKGNERRRRREGHGVIRTSYL